MPTSLLLVASETIPVVDIDNTVFIQGALFLLLMVVLKFLLFDPWLATRDRRAARIGGAIEEASQLREAAAERQGDYDARLVKARDEAMSLRSEHRRGAEERETEIVSAARGAASESLDQTKAKIAKDVDAARGDLASRVESLATDITTRVLGRPA